MITDVGKNTPSLFMGDGSVYTFVNDTVIQSTWHYRDTNGLIRYTVSDTSAPSAKFRALHFYRSFPGSNRGGALKVPVIYLTNSLFDSANGSTGISAQFLYECIAPQIAVNKEQVFQLFFWTNVTDVSSFKTLSDNEKIYNQDNVVKFSNDELGDIDFTSQKVLCSANINFEMLSVQETSRIQIPVIRKIVVLDIINDGNVITDFAGGGGGGLKIHNHADNSNGGFAFSVYSPSSIMRTLSWE